MRILLAMIMVAAACSGSESLNGRYSISVEPTSWCVPPLTTATIAGDTATVVRESVEIPRDEMLVPVTYTEDGGLAMPAFAVPGVTASTLAGPWDVSEISYARGLDGSLSGPARILSPD